jgi:hypothetical protein
MRTINKTTRKIRFLIAVLIASLSFTSFYAQTGFNPVMKISNGKTVETPVQIELFNIDIKVVGQIATTTLDITYRNPNNRVLEGEFNFPLGEGQTVSRFALDIGGKLREGVVVDKTLGRKTFESIVRRGADPGLLEKTAGNNFRARVYPIPASGTRRIVIAYEQELTDNGAYDLYLLPLTLKETVSKFTVHAEVIKRQVHFDQENNQLSNLSFSKWNDSYISNLEMTNYTPDKQIAFDFPHVTDSANVFTAPINNLVDSSYFYVNIRPDRLEKEKTLPSQITLLWDNSSSCKNRNIEKELEILDAYIKKIGNLTIGLVPFNITTEKADTFKIMNGSWENLKSVIKGLNYDGGTSLGCIDFTKYHTNEILLFSDGISNFGLDEPKFSNIPVNVINSNGVANHSFLTYIAQRTGGIYLNVGKLTSAEVLSMLTKSSYHFISAKVENGKVSNIYPSMPCTIGNSFSMAGIMAGKEATVTLNFGFGSTIVYSKKVIITNENSSDINLLRRIWAEKKIAELLINEEKNKNEINQTGKEFGIVTSNTSLIVLETLSDYIQYQIVPPAELQQEYFVSINAKENETLEKVKNHIDYVVTLSDEQSKWWKQTFIVPAKGSVSIRTVAGGSDDGIDIADMDQGTTQVVADEVSTVTVVENMPPVIKADEEVSSDQVIVTQEELHQNSSANSVKTEVGMGVGSGYGSGNGPGSGSGNTSAKPKIPTIEESANIDIQLNSWDPQSPYLKVLQYAVKGQEYETYLKLKDEYGTTPAFYADASDFFLKLKEKAVAKKVLSNLAEISLESPELQRTLGKKLLDLNCNDDAVQVFEKVQKLRTDEPQSYHDLGLAYEANGNHQQAIETLYEVVKKESDSRFNGIELIVMNQINSIIARYPSLNYSFIDKRLIKKEPVDIRVEITWNADNCDIDLWVTDPYGEKCFYSNPRTSMGGKISSDFTQGYGPEEFMLKKAVTGKYIVQANYYGTRSQTLLTPVSIHVAFITNFGKVNQKKQEATIRLDNTKEIIDIGKFSFVKAPQVVTPKTTPVKKR